MSSQLGTDQRALRVAVVGSGPSGFYAAQSLLKADINVGIDIFDRLPAPFGLVRYGVAPDHAKIKNVTKIYSKTMEDPRVNFWGNVFVGKDISVNDLKKYFDAVVFCVGAESDRNLGIDGEYLRGSYTATEFVAWYNGHPDYRERHFDLSQEVAVVIGQGNVAMDVCRILCKTVDELKTTDIAEHALKALSESKIKEVHMIGRRGPAQAAFTPVEIREFGEFGDCDPVIAPESLQLSQASQSELEDSNNTQKKKNYEILTALSQKVQSNKGKKLFVHFLKSPVEILGEGRVEKVVLEKNELTGEPGNQKSKGTGIKEELPCGIFFRSVGYRGLPVRGLPFHDQWGIIPNQEGRIADSEHIFTGLYVAGWIKRGPSGVIGTNKPDSEETVAHLLEDLGELTPCEIPDTQELLSFLREKKIRYITKDDWKKLDEAEIKAGEAVGKPREKFVSVLDVLHELGDS